jgi:hypothetical protein
LSFCLALGLTLCVAPVLGQTADSGTQAEADSEAGADFVPPSDGPPGDRAGAGTRAVSGASGPLTIIAPEGGGLTTLAAPPLIWRLSEAVAGDILAGIADTDPSGPAVKGSFRGPFAKGLYAIDLRRSEMRLVEGHIYRFTVSVIDPGGRALAEASTFVERTLGTRTDQATTPGDEVELLKQAAGAGLWFDALALVVEPDLSGRARVVCEAEYDRLLRSAGVQ